MIVFNYIATAFRQLRRNTGRSVLTMLGIIIGIGSVIFIMSTGELAKQFLLGQITQFGTNIVEVAVPGTFGPGDASHEITLTKKDIDLVNNSSLLPEVTAISAGVFSTQTLAYEENTLTSTVNGDYPGYFIVNKIRLKKGRLYNSTDVMNASKVVVVDDAFAQKVFTSVDEAIGKKVKIGGKSFRVIGVIEKMSFGAASFGIPDVVYVPITTVQQLFADPAEINYLGYMLVQFADGTNVESFKNRFTYVINSAHGLLDKKDAGFTIVSRDQALDIFNNRPAD